jgi:bacterioferritin (cytochrome b1)
MLGNVDVIKTLNTMLFNELTAIDRYFLHARMLQNRSARCGMQIG